MRKHTLRPTHRLKTLQKGTIIAGGVSVMALAAYFLIGLQSASNDSVASGYELLTNDPLNNGEIISGFTWESSPVIADVGPSASTISKNAEIVSGGSNSAFGLSAGNTGKDLDMNIGNCQAFNGDGIDVSIDFRRFEESGNFFTRGNNFNFGMKDGKLCIRYKLLKENGKHETIDELTKYDIPEDTIFRNYRFIYNPSESKGEIFVDNVAVWSSTADDGSKMEWNTTSDMMVGQGINGGNTAKAVFDNLLIRSTNRARTMPLKLLSFSAEVRGENVMVTWFTSQEKDVDYFRVERSTDTYSYKEIGKVKATGNSSELKAYALLDKRPDPGVVYYRLSLPNTDVKSVWVPVIALKIKNTAPSTISGENSTQK